MRLLTGLGTLVTLVALSANFGCSKESDETTTNTVSADPAAKDVAGMAKQTLLALKFHHDS